MVYCNFSFLNEVYQENSDFSLFLKNGCKKTGLSTRRSRGKTILKLAVQNNLQG